MTTSVVNIRLTKKFTRYIGRGSKWGNRFVIGKDGTREQVCQKYREWLPLELIVASREELRGEILGCFCKPKQCHGDILAEIADSD